MNLLQEAFVAAEEPVVSEATVKQQVELDPGNNSLEVILVRQPQHNNRQEHKAQANNVDEHTVLIFLNY